MKEYEKKSELLIDAEDQNGNEKTGPSPEKFNGMPSCHSDDAWVQQYRDDFGTEPSFF